MDDYSSRTPNPKVVLKSPLCESGIVLVSSQTATVINDKELGTNFGQGKY